MKEMGSVRAIVLAGGVGERFWPESRPDRPKQLLKIAADGRSLLEHSIERAEQITGRESVWISTSASLRESILSAVPFVNPYQVLGEPAWSLRFGGCRFRR